MAKPQGQRPLSTKAPRPNARVVAVGRPGIPEMVADEGYHSNQSLEDLHAVGVRAYVSEPKRGRRR